jgi:hypothetical protein
MDCSCDAISLPKCPECGYERPTIVRHELEYRHGPLSFREEVKGLTAGKHRLRYVLNHTNCDYPISDVAMTGFDDEGTPQVMANWYGNLGGWGPYIYP